MSKHLVCIVDIYNHLIISSAAKIHNTNSYKLTHTHTHEYTHTHTHIQIHTHTHIQIHTHTHTSSQLLTPALTPHTNYQHST